MSQLGAINDGEFKSKVACETAVLPFSSGSDAGVRCGTAISTADDADAPEESVLPRVRGGVGFVELFGAALRRDGSTKGSSNPKAAGAPRAGSRRMPAAGKAAVVVAVLPAGKAIAQERRRGWRRPAAGARVFASEAVGAAAEPASPKVSCFGAVRSEKRAAPPGKRAEEEAKRGGCWASVTAAVRRRCWNDNGDAGVAELEASGTSSTSAASALESAPGAALSPPRHVVGLGDVKRLASRRWPETMMAGEGPFGAV